MIDVAVDVGSGVTKVRAGDKRFSVPSLAGIPTATGHDIEETEGAIVQFDNETYATGERAHTEVRPDKLVNTRDDSWYEKDAYLALLYNAMAKVLPKGYEGKVSLCTGLPQALFLQHREKLAKRLARKHRFTVNGDEFKLYIRMSDIRILPQVMGLFISRLDLDRSLQYQKVAVIDVGTYTSDWTIVDQCKTLHWASGGAPIGISNVIEGIREYLSEEHRNRCSYAVAAKAVRERQIRSGERMIDLADHIDKIAFANSELLLASLSEHWGDGKDSKIIVGGGGCHVYAPAIRSCLAHAEVIADKDPMYSIVDGYHSYLFHSRQKEEKGRRKNTGRPEQAA